MPRRTNNTLRAPQRPRRCGRCTMFGHDRRTCHLNGSGNQILMANNNWRLHCDINAQWVAEGGAGHSLPEPKPPKTPFELACENKCKVTETNECCICMEALGKKNTATTACGHQFHFACLSRHTTNSNKCPMCRAVICPEIPKRIINAPSIDNLLGFARRSATQVMEPISQMAHLNDGQTTIVTDAMSNVISDISFALIENIRRRNP